MRMIALGAALVLAGCGGGGRNEAAAGTGPTSTDAVTAEAVRDTQAAEAEAMKAADAELDNLGNSIDDKAPARNASSTADRVSNTTKVEVY